MSTPPLYQLEVDFFKTLGHPVRICVLELLSSRECAVAEMLPEVGVEGAHLSQQLAILRRANLVATRKEGSTVYYHLTTPEVANLLTAARSILSGVLAGQADLLADLQAAPEPMMPSSTHPTGADATLAPELQGSDHTNIDRALHVLRGPRTKFVLIRRHARALTGRPARRRRRLRPGHRHRHTVADGPRDVGRRHGRAAPGCVLATDSLPPARPAAEPVPSVRSARSSKTSCRPPRVSASYTRMTP